MWSEAMFNSAGLLGNSLPDTIHCVIVIHCGVAAKEARDEHVGFCVSLTNY